MSGLGDARRRVSCSFRQQALAPRMSRGRLDRTPRDLGLGRLSHSLGTSGDGVIVQWSAVVRDPHRPIHPLFDHDVGRSDIGSHLIELPVARHFFTVLARIPLPRINRTTRCSPTPYPYLIRASQMLGLP